MAQMTVAETAKEWGISERRVLALCNAGRVEGAQKFGWSWAIPTGTTKPNDARRKDDLNIDEILSSIGSGIRMERIWAMPNRRTFEIKPIKDLILSELTNGVWIDPFAGNNKLANITNDLNQIYDTDYHLDALDFLKLFDDDSIDGILYDPPYSPRQVSECYQDVGYNVTWDMTKASFWGNHKREISRIVKSGGKVITFGWNSGGIGMKNGFEIKRILLVPHGGWHNDTICTVEQKVKKITIFLQISLFELPETLDDDGLAKDEALISQLCALPQDFWDFKNADTKELTHGLHNYPAVMVSPISRNIIKIMKSIMPINTLFDPFAGSGTVLVEGVVSEIQTIYGNDLNPLAQLITKVKTTPITQEKLENIYNQLIMLINVEMEKNREIRDSVDDYIINQLGLDITAKDGWGSNALDYLMTFLNDNSIDLSFPEFKNIGYWYRPKVLIDLQIIKNCIKRIPNGAEKDIFWLTFSEITRLVSNRRNGEFKMYRITPEKLKTFSPDVIKEFFEILNRNIGKIIDFSNVVSELNLKQSVSVLSENSMILDGIPENSVDLIITSPPYGDSRTTVAYGEFSKLSLLWLDLYNVTEESIIKMDRALMGGKKYRNGFEYTLNSETLYNSLEKIKDSDIERAGDVYSFYVDLDKAISAISKKMKQGGYQFWVVGNRTVKLENLQTDKILIELSKRYGLVHVYSVGRNIPNKVMPSLNSPTNEPGKKVTTMTNEHIVIFRKT